MRIHPSVAKPGDTVSAICTYRILVNRYPLIGINRTDYHITEIRNIPKFDYSHSANASQARIIVLHQSISTYENGTTYECYFSLINGTVVRSNTGSLVIQLHRELTNT